MPEANISLRLTSSSGAMMQETLIHSSALLLLNFKRRDLRNDPGVRSLVMQLVRSLKQEYEIRPARGYRDEEPATGVFCAFDAGIKLAEIMRERGFRFPRGHRFEDRQQDICFHFKYAPGRSLTSDPRGTRYETKPCELRTRGGRPLRPLDFFQTLRRECLSWRDGAGAALFDEDSEVFLVGARPLPMIEMFAGLQPHDFTDAFPDSGIRPVQPQTGNLLFIQLQQENLARWREAGGEGRRRSMGGLFTSRVLAPGDSYALEFQNRGEEFDPTVNSIYIDREVNNDPNGLGYVCRIHDGFSTNNGALPFKVVMRESFLPGIERPDIVGRYCALREAEMAAVKFNSSLDHIRISRGGIEIVEVPLRTNRIRVTGDAREGLIGDVDFDADIPLLTVRLPYLFFPDIEIPSSLLARNPVVRWVNEHAQGARHTISFWPQTATASHRAQCLKALSGRLVVNAEYLSSGRARAGMDNVLVYRDDFHLETARRLIAGASQACRLSGLEEDFNSIFTGRTPRTEDALAGFVDMMIAMLGGGGDTRAGGGGIA
ncbi:MAG TPA: hypothetical protein VLD57_07555, partial [Blastocatellia bacterium]|nr:hypothetical protein [Blastocatellia bacterium]